MEKMHNSYEVLLPTLEHDSPPPSYPASIRIDAHKLQWTYDTARGFWITLEVPGCQIVGFGNDTNGGKATYPEFFVACTLEHECDAVPEKYRTKFQQNQCRSFMKAAEALAHHRRKHHCNCDFTVGSGIRQRNTVGLTIAGGPPNISQRARQERHCKMSIWEHAQLIWVIVCHNCSCKRHCMEREVL